MVKINKKIIIDQKPKSPILFKETAQGKRKVTSKYRVKSLLKDPNIEIK